MTLNARLMQLGKVYHNIDVSELEPRDSGFDTHIKGELVLSAEHIAKEKNIPLGDVRKRLRSGLAQTLVEKQAMEQLEGAAEKHNGIIVMGTPNIVVTKLSFSGGLIARFIGDYEAVINYEATVYCRTYNRPKPY